MRVSYAPIYNLSFLFKMYVPTHRKPTSPLLQGIMHENGRIDLLSDADETWTSASSRLSVLVQYRAILYSAQVTRGPHDLQSTPSNAYR